MKPVVVIGGGPAGMMAAIRAAENGAAVTLLEKMPALGRKMMITGKGRCNLTNLADIPEIIRQIPGNGVFLNSVLRAFDNQAVIRFFEEQGVPTKGERGGRVFPVSDRAQDAVDAMIRRLRELRVRVKTKAAVRHILTEAGAVRGVETKDGERLEAAAVILAAGGASYPGTGSDGSGAVLARETGHTIVPLQPALVPLETAEDWPKTLTGLTLKNVRASLLVEGNVVGEEFGEMLFTHFGVSGPIILTLSREAAHRLRQGAAVGLEIDLKPALDRETLDRRVQRDFSQYQRKAVKNALSGLLPTRLIPVVLTLSELVPEKPVHQVTRAERQRLTTALKHLPLTISGTRPLAEAIVTAGGVSTREINPRTMESKLVRGLYFAGETVDIDGYTGGYNLQAAFSTGAAAGWWSAAEVKEEGEHGDQTD
ncbi:MAG: NAD(P)/FAD-dependent oxidoreductase [Schwartzia sp.]|nr:NAD(P)/FAD-dependent oxidoreductase [Schwartzia sp. (in: firmicutes)]